MKTSATCYVVVFVPVPKAAAAALAVEKPREWPDWTMFIRNPRPLPKQPARK